ncbi:MAG: flippase-like domain-containing protein [Bacteroidales bacterium]|nr:flippase-like domain-containing protein [Bacteroidales bacterium]
MIRDFIQFLKANLNNLIRILLYLSIIFLLVYIYKNGLFIAPKIYNPAALVISLALLFAGFLIDVRGWQLIINGNGRKVKFKHALISTGLYIFTKYIPGKIWIILGKANYMKKHAQLSLTDLSGLALTYQIFSLVGGLCIGLFGIMKFGFDTSVLIIIILFTGLLIMSLFSGFLGKIAGWFIGKVIKKQYHFTTLSKAKMYKIFIITLLVWLSWATGFYFFALAIIPGGEISPLTGFGFPFAAVWGVVAFFAPGGIGVREGILTAYLNLSDLNIEYATSISVFSRIWFLIGETFIFCMALFMKTLNESVESVNRHPKF